MAARARALHLKATDQVDTLIDFVSGLDDANPRRPCRGREKLGDGTIVAHTAANYERIAALTHQGHQVDALIQA